MQDGLTKSPAKVCVWIYIYKIGWKISQDVSWVLCSTANSVVLWITHDQHWHLCLSKNGLLLKFNYIQHCNHFVHWNRQLQPVRTMTHSYFLAVATKCIFLLFMPEKQTRAFWQALVIPYTLTVPYKSDHAKLQPNTHWLAESFKSRKWQFVSSYPHKMMPHLMTKVL